MSILINTMLRKQEHVNGPYKIIETVTTLDAPTRSLVRLCDPKTGYFVKEAFSDEITGIVSFENIQEGPWFLYAFDPTNTYEAVIIQNRLATLTGARP